MTVESLELVGEEHGARANSGVQAWHCPCTAFAGKRYAQEGFDSLLVSVQLASEIALFSAVLEKREFPLYQWIARQSQRWGQTCSQMFFAWKN